MGRQIRAVVFDLDGTLVDSPNAIATITAEILGEFGAAADEAEIRSTVGQPLDANFSRLLGASTTDPVVTRAIELYKKRFGAHVRAQGEALLYPDVANGLAVLRDHGLRLAIATSKVQEAAVRTVTATGIAGAFDAVVGHDSVPRGKPHPDLALRAAELVGVTAADCAGVGDAVGDMRMGRAAGCYNIGVSYGVATEGELRDAGADTVADTFPEVVRALLAMIGAESGGRPVAGPARAKG